VVLAAGRLLFAGTADEMVRRHGSGPAVDAEAAELAFVHLVAPEAAEGGA
jgi:hypothetical protein